jgi:CcmD family protein
MIYLITAFSAFFLLVFAYTVWMGSKQRDIERKITDLRRTIERDSRAI